MTEQLVAAIASLNEVLVDNGIEMIPVSSAFDDQAQATFRADLLQLGIDPAEPENVQAALAGFVIGIKVLAQQNLPLPYIAQHVGLADKLVSILDAEPVDVAELPDLGFLEGVELPDASSVILCTQCEANPAAVEISPTSRLCFACTRAVVLGGIAAVRLANHGWPQVGGPGFERGPDPQPRDETGRWVADIGPKSWREMTIADLMGWKGKHRRRRGQD
jgi:hypothetical protein